MIGSQYFLRFFFLSENKFTVFHPDIVMCVYVWEGLICFRVDSANRSPAKRKQAVQRVATGSNVVFW